MNKLYKWIRSSLIGVMLLMCCTSLFAEPPFTKIVFFGDSLTDNGNLYRTLLKFLPKSPPYYLGRFSNGPTWAEDVGKYYYDKYYIDYSIYAVGGATAIFHVPTTKFIPPSFLSLQVDQYLLESIFQDKSKILYAIWIGANDYFYDDKNGRTADMNQLTSDVVDKIHWAVSTLVDYGANNFLILGMPDLSVTPYAQTSGSHDRLEMMSAMHNDKLQLMYKNLKREFPQATINYVDVGGKLNDAIKDPSKYNEKYHINITNTTQACWDGGLYLRNARLNAARMAALSSELRQYDKAFTEKYNTELVSNFILSTPTLEVAYNTSKLYQEGKVPCGNAEEHIFWDEIHPTQVVHLVLAKIVEELLDKEYKM